MKILIVDDHPLIRRGLRQTLESEPGLSVVAEAGTAEDALDRLREAEFDLLILDVNLPGRSGLEALGEIRRSQPHLPILMLSIHPDDSVALHAVEAGANGYLCKHIAPEELVRAVRKLGAGGRYYSDHLMEMMALKLSGRAAALPHESLTDREYQVMCLLAVGKSITEIAALLNRAPTTVSSHRTRILGKMGMTTNSELTRYAIANGLVS